MRCATWRPIGMARAMCPTVSSWPVSPAWRSPSTSAPTSPPALASCPCSPLCESWRCRMRTGDMDRRVTLQRFTTTQDEYGEEIQTWTDLTPVFAEVRQPGGKEYLAAAPTHAERRVVFFVSWFPGLPAARRVTYDDGKEVGLGARV